MTRESYHDILAFIAVARARSFTRAAAQLGMSQSALSHTIRALETRLGLRLLTRTTRSVAPTTAGERLLASVAPRFDEIAAELSALTELRDKPAGTLRITAADYAIDTVLMPRLAPLLPAYPDIRLEIVVDYGLTDIVAARFDAGVRLGDQVERDMIAVRIAPDLCMRVVGAPAYFATHPRPLSPRALLEHNCINLHLPSYGGLYAWEFARQEQALNVRVDGQLVFNGTTQMLNAARAGLGLAYLPQDLVQADLDAGRLQSVLEDWCPSFTGLHLYYPSRRQSSRALALVVEALRYHG